MISFFHTYKIYSGEVMALRDVTLDITKGEFVYLTGPSGAGKTTLFRLLSAFDRPTSGEIHVAGYDLNKIKKNDVPYFRRKIGVIYQDFRLLKKRNVSENVALPLEIRGASQAIMNQKSQDILAQVGLAHKAKSYPEQLSGGEQQRVALARALIHQPGILIADEPTGNLDPDLSLEIMDLLDQINAQGTTVFVATHDLDIVRKKSRRTIQIKDGSILQDSP